MLKGHEPILIIIIIRIPTEGFYYPLLKKKVAQRPPLSLSTSLLQEQKVSRSVYLLQHQGVCVPGQTLAPEWPVPRGGAPGPNILGQNVRKDMPAAGP